MKKKNDDVMYDFGAFGKWNHKTLIAQRQKDDWSDRYIPSKMIAKLFHELEQDYYELIDMKIKKFKLRDIIRNITKLQDFDKTIINYNKICNIVNKKVKK